MSQQNLSTSKLSLFSTLINRTLLTLAITSFAAGCSKKEIDQTLVPSTKTELAEKAAAADFTIAVLPDAQFYSDPTQSQNGEVAMFQAQTNWIMANRVAQNIAFVAQVGDITNDGSQSFQWVNAWSAMKTLETPYTGFPNGIPYGVAVGNHDQRPDWGNPDNPCTLYNQYFGVSHFQGRAYYKGHYGSNSDHSTNESHYECFTAGGVDWVVVSIEYDDTGDYWEGMHNWARDVLNANRGRKAIVVSHFLITNGKAFGAQGQDIYDKLKNCKNLVMMLCGHVNGETYRVDFNNGNRVTTILTDYQDYLPHGGDGYLRLLKVSTTRNEIVVKCYSPYLKTWRTEGQYTLPLWNDIAVPADYDGDGKADKVTWNQSTGYWTGTGTTGVAISQQWGASGDIPVPADYNADGKADYSVFRPSTAKWYRFGMDSGAASGGIKFGDINSSDIPVPGDYDGDDTAEIALFRQTSRIWYVNLTTKLGPFTTQQWGNNADEPAQADYNGDGKIDYCVYRRSTSEFFRFGIDPGTNGFKYGDANSDDIPVPADYTGDARADIAVWRQSNGTWYVNTDNGVNEVGSTIEQQWGQRGDAPLPANYGGIDGKADYTVFRPMNNTWYLR